MTVLVRAIVYMNGRPPHHRLRKRGLGWIYTVTQGRPKMANMGRRMLKGGPRFRKVRSLVKLLNGKDMRFPHGTKPKDRHEAVATRREVCDILVGLRNASLI